MSPAPISRPTTPHTLLLPLFCPFTKCAFPPSPPCTIRVGTSCLWLTVILLRPFSCGVSKNHTRWCLHKILTPQRHAITLQVAPKYCRQMHLTRVFSHAPCTCDHTHIVAQGVSGAQSLHPHAIQDVTCLSVRLLSLRVCLFPVSLPLLPCLFHSQPVLCPAQFPQCRHRRGLKPLHSSTMRSIAAWRFSILSQVMSRLLRDFCNDLSG